MHFNVHVHTHRDVCGCYIFMPQKNWLTFLYLAFISLVLFEITLHFLLLIPVIIWDAVLCIFCIWTIPDCGYTHSLEILHWSLLDVLACSTLDFSAKMKTSLNSIHSIHSYWRQVISAIMHWNYLEILGFSTAVKFYEPDAFFFFLNKQSTCLLYGLNSACGWMFPVCLWLKFNV